MREHRPSADRRAGEVRLVVVKRGREWPGLMMLDPGDRIASRWYDPTRQCHVVEVMTPDVPASPEVQAAAAAP